MDSRITLDSEVDLKSQLGTRVTLIGALVVDQVYLCLVPIASVESHSEKIKVLLKYPGIAKPSTKLRSAPISYPWVERCVVRGVLARCDANLDVSFMLVDIDSWIESDGHTEYEVDLIDRTLVSWEQIEEISRISTPEQMASMIADLQRHYLAWHL